MNEKLNLGHVIGCDSRIKIPKPTLKFEGLENITIVGEKPMPMEELFDLYLRLERFLKEQENVLLSKRGEILGVKSYR